MKSPELGLLSAELQPPSSREGSRAPSGNGRLPKVADRGTHLNEALVWPARSQGAPPRTSLAADLWSQVCLW